MKKFFQQYKVYNPPILWAIMIFSLSTMSKGSFPDIDEWLKFIFDKIVHLLLYLIFTVLLMVSLIKQNNSFKLKRYCIGISLAISASYGILIEFYQAYMTTTRSGNYEDVIANLSGSIIGILGFYLIYGKPKDYIY